MSSEETPVAVDQAAPKAEEAPKPKRTRRTVKKTEDAAPVAVAAEEAAPKKRATRAKKADADSPEAVEAAKAAKPAKTTRTKKAAKADAADAPAAEAPATDAAAVTASAADAATAEAPAEAPKRRRGRPRKTEVAAEAAQAPVAEAAAKAEPAVEGGETKAEETPAEAPKKRRGRPRKTAAPVDSPADGESAAPAQAATAPAMPEPPLDPVPVSSYTEAAPSAPEAGSAPAPAESGEKQDKQESQEKQVDKQEKQVDKQEKQGDKQGEKHGEKHGDKPRMSRRERERERREARRQKRKEQQQAQQPQIKKEDLEQLKVSELRVKAAELELDTKGLLKADLVEAVYAAAMKKEGFENVEGVLDIMPDGYGFLRSKGYLPGEKDAYLNGSLIRRNNLRKGDYIVGQVRPLRNNEKFAALHKIDTVNGKPVEELGKRVKFADLTPVFPDERLWMEHGKSTITARVIDLTAPIGKGQRGLIVSPPKAGKTTVLKDIAAAITANNPEVHLMCLLVDERPEEVTDMERSVKGEVIASTFDMPAENHIAVAEMVIERAKRLVENGEDVVILLDSITRLARAYNLAQPASGRILSGGVDSTALYPPKRFLGAARNIENGGSLTILASALIDTGSKMDEVIFEEFKGTGNMELKLDRYLADRRIFPAIDPVASGTRKEELMMNPQEAPLIWAVRRVLANLNNTERAMDMLIKSLKQTNNNQEFLLRTAKKFQGRTVGEILEF